MTNQTDRPGKLGAAAAVVGSLLFFISAVGITGAEERSTGFLKTEHFDNEPGWEGFNNRLKPDPKEIPTIDQDFGYSDTHFAGGEKGELGGKTWRSVTPAFYAAKIPVKTLDDKLTASGRFTFAASAGNAGIWFGWFSAGRQQVGGARPKSALGMNMDFAGDGARLSVRLVNDKDKGCGTFVTPYLPGKFRTAPLGRNIQYAWTLTYDPQANSGNGRVEFTIKSINSNPGHDAKMKSLAEEWKAVYENTPESRRKLDARCAGVLFVDLDNDRDLDLVISNHVNAKGHLGSRLFENQGRGQFRDATPAVGPWPDQMGTRNIAALDLNADGLLDLVVADGTYGRNAQAEARLMALENQGGFRFADTTGKLGLQAAGTFGLGLAVGDVNQDGRLDLFVAGSNRLFISEAQGRYREAHPGRFAVSAADVEEGVHCGAAFADLNGDDLLDLVTTEHGAPTQLHLFVNRGVRDGLPDLVEVSKHSGAGDVFPTGTRERPMKTNHVALRDMDNDGKPDIVLAMIYQADGGHVQPVVLRNLSERGSELKFDGPPFDRLIGVYTPAPVADYDRDGRVDVFLPSWTESLPNLLFRNVSRGGHWLSVRVRSDDPDYNAMGVGAVVRLYQTGQLGNPKNLLGRYDIVVGTGYASCEEAIAHFGLGTSAQCDVQVNWGARQVNRTGVAANQSLTIDLDRASQE